MPTVDFDTEEAAAWESLLPAPPTLFPLTESGTPAGRWGTLEAGDQIPADRPDVGYGLACGIRSGGLVVLDLDVKGGQDGPGALRALEDRVGRLPATLTVATPSGGTHLYFVASGAFQSNASKIGPGIDVRADGGYVRIPGSPPGYRLVRAVRPAPLPEAWAAFLPRPAGTPGTVPPAAPEPLPDLNADELRARLAEDAKGRKGGVWSAWRAVSRGERFVRVRGGDLGPPIPDEFGGVDEFLTKGLFAELVTVSEFWPRVESAAFLSLFGPSLSILQSDDQRAGNAIYTDAQIAQKWERAREYGAQRAAARRGADEFARKLLAKIHGTLPLLVVYSGSVYVRSTTSGPPYEYLGPKLRSDVWVTCRDVWAGEPDVYRPGRSGPVRMSPDDLIERYGQAVDAVVHDVSASEAEIAGRALILPTARIAVEPVYHADVAAWLDAYDPDGPLHDWIAVLTDLKYAAPALWLTGAPKIGKSLLARGLARIWGGQPTPMVRAFAEFNDAVLGCPLIEAAEEIPKNSRGYQDTERLKELISQTERKINEKHKPIRDVLGAVRVILSSNNTNLIRNAADLTAEDAQALADRFVHVHVEPAHAARIRARLPSPRTIQDVWINGGRIAEHALYLAQTRSVPFGPRLRMASHSEALYRLFVTQPGAGFGVCAALYKWLATQARTGQDGGPPSREGVGWAHETVCTSAEAVLGLMSDDEKRRHNRRSIGQTLRRLSLDHERRSVRLPGEEKPRRLWAVDLDHVRQWTKEEGWGDPHELEQAIQTLRERYRP